jgi:hypothetical protein
MALRGMVKGLAASWLGCLVVASAAQAAPRQEFEFRFTTQAVASSTGFSERIDYVNPDDPAEKPHGQARVVLLLHPGSRIDTSVPNQCKATDAELILLGEAACPAGSKLGGGTVGFDDGLTVTSNNVTLFNNQNELIVLTETADTPVPVRTATRTAVGERSFTTEVPPVPGVPPPDPFFALTDAEFDVHPVSSARGSYIKTPATCPRSRHWTNSLIVTYRDGVTQTAQSKTRCRRPTSRSRR